VILEIRVLLVIQERREILDQLVILEIRVLLVILERREIKEKLVRQDKLDA
jgi:hypothetical protein